MCPRCTSDYSEVLETRAKEGYIRRRRRCGTCDIRYSTIEIYIKFPSSKNAKSIINRDNIIRQIAKLTRLI